MIFALLVSTPIGAQTQTTTNDASTRAYQKAVESAEAELETIRARIEAEAKELDDKILLANTSAVALAEEEAELRQTLEKLIDDDFDVTGKAQDAERETRSQANQIDALWSELRTQSVDLASRFRESVVHQEFPKLLETIEPIGTAPTEVPSDLEAKIETLLDAYARIVRVAATARTFEGPIQLTFENGRIEPAQILRLGLIGGFYHHAGTGEAGFVHADEETRGQMVGRAAGLTPAQMTSIAAMVGDPGNASTIPFDVTGGAGLASLQAADNVTTWFEKGGKFMWPLLIVAVLAFLIIIERAVMLTLRTRGIQSRIRKLLDLVEAGKIEEAESRAAHSGGAVGRVFHAALVHRNQDRSVMEDAVQEALLHEIPSFQKRLAFIALCAAVAPLMGLLGTVTGMITTFKMVTIFGTSDPRFMAGGISEALITTQGGLYLAIPCLLCRGVLGAVADSALGRLETGAMSSVLAILKHHEGERARAVQVTEEDSELHESDDEAEPERALNAEDANLTQLRMDTVPDAIADRLKARPRAEEGGVEVGS